MAEFLFEIGLEEVPARMIPGAEAELLRRTFALLEREHLVPAGATVLEHAKSYSTPRRLAVWIKDVLATQPDITEETTGPAVKIAFKDGVPTPAAEAFARKAGVAVSELKTIETPKGEYLAASTVKKGRSAAEVIASELPKEIAAIYWAKNMYWRAGKPERFVRPVLWLVCLLGEDVVPVSFAGKTAGRATFGHRVLSSNEPFEIVTPASYPAQLEGEYVLVDVAARRHKIRKALDHVCRTVAGARWREDHALVDKMTHLTEWPDVLLGSFEAEYLALPEEVLVTVMRDHQNYFAVESADGKLAPHFLAVLNIALTETNAPIIKQGNERVLRARFNDARFFWEFDQRVPLVERVKLLENVTFQKDLGSYAAKSERVRSRAFDIARAAAANGAMIDLFALDETVTLAKTDLTTELVKEFTELQGIIGGLYARSEGRKIATWKAIYDQYLPASGTDPIPRSTEGAIFGIADRMDTLSSMFSLGVEPTGSKDPFALRRAGNAIVRILAESSVPLSLTNVILEAPFTEPLQLRLSVFFSERVEFYLRDVLGISYDVVNAVIRNSFDDLKDTVARARAVSEARSGSDFLAVSAAFKRMKNILLQSQENNDEILSFEPLFATRFEEKFWIEVREAAEGYRSDCDAKDYSTALVKLARLRPLVDQYFESVMVMDADLSVRASRLGTLRYLLAAFSRIADFSEIVTAG